MGRAFAGYSIVIVRNALAKTCDLKNTGDRQRGAMHGRKKSDLPQTKEEKDAIQAKISNYKKVSEMGKQRGF